MVHHLSFEEQARKLHFAYGIGLLLCVFCLIYSRGGYLGSWDGLLYAYAAQFQYPLEKIINRYVHIYLIRSFYLVFGDIFVATRVMWAFTMTAAAGFVYVAVYSLLERKDIVRPTLAVFFLLANDLIMRKVGTTWADYTVLAFVAASCYIFTQYYIAEGGAAKRLLYISLILVCLLALKSKETGIVTGIAVLAAAWQRGLSIKLVIDTVVAIAVFVVLMVAMDFFFLGDPFWQLNIDNYLKTASFNIFRVWEKDHTTNYYINFLAQFTFTGSLYLVSPFINAKKPSSRALVGIWVMGAALIVFLNLTRICGAWDTIGRYLIPVMPVVAICAARALPNEYPGTGSKLQLLMGLLLIGVSAGLAWLGLYILMNHFYPTLSGFGWNATYYQIHLALVIPCTTCLVLFLLTLEKKRIGGLLIVVMAIMSLAPYVAREFSFEAAHLSRFETPRQLLASSGFDAEKDKVALVALPQFSGPGRAHWIFSVSSNALVEKPIVLKGIEQLDSLKGVDFIMLKTKDYVENEDILQGYGKHKGKSLERFQFNKVTLIKLIDRSVGNLEVLPMK